VKVSVTAVMLTVKVLPSLCGAPSFCYNEINPKIVGQVTLQCLDHIFKGLCLLKFSDPYKHFSVHFLDDLESYFLLRGMSVSFKLVIARRSAVDSYKIKWINTVYKDPINYEQFREAVTKFCEDQKCTLDGDVIFFLSKCV
jgi:hypothetical protein